MDKLIIDIVTNNATETEEVGAKLAEIVSSRENAFIALYGDLGTGKTAFTRGFCSVAAPNDRICSPTFAIINEYKSGKIPVFHFDVYRIIDDDDLYSTGFYEYIEEGYILCEWSENIPYAIPDNRIEVKITKTDPDEYPDRRLITITEFGV